MNRDSQLCESLSAELPGTGESSSCLERTGQAASSSVKWALEFLPPGAAVRMEAENVCESLSTMPGT